MLQDLQGPGLHGTLQVLSVRRPDPSRTAGGVALVFVRSFAGCHDAFTWLLEVLPVIVGVPVLIRLYPRLRFTNLVYLLIALHATILMIGGQYTYALIPVFEWIKQAWHLDRNYYDRLGHFAQGFVPDLIAREVLCGPRHSSAARCSRRW